ncbi:Zn-dependent protease [Halodesulfurarchaeum formicicum]|uniref:Zinc metalloprotease n=1 Tax=Halodesulfurarchaeum formicicum TaxID=1873524 RepID=A0A1D8S1T5_9EURY|nr:CBS domain-containing protein [Halodesulfurarchaeum formicicum]AOW79318.1 Zn-dependent protease [Halodesulfurarchaeum formicicum]APE94583.1 Zn-dependent protease [Halodesulfurarchaeum formicicum]
MRSFKIGSAFGIPVKLNITFLLVLPIFAWLIGSQVGELVALLNQLWGLELDAAILTAGSMPAIVGMAAAIGLFAGVLLHEFGHALVAMHYGFPIESITLWFLGGIAQLSEQPEDWRTELLIAIAGPIVSVGLGVGLWIVLVLLPMGPDVLLFLLAYLALINIALAVFNMLPGFPMDGGRVLRALLARKRSFARATQLAAEVGKGVAILMGIAGLFGGNIILIGIAFFIYIGAAGESQQTTLKAAFEGVTVADIMTPAESVSTVEPETTVADLVEKMFRERHTGFPVERGEEIVGVVTLSDARQIDPVERDAHRVADVMTTDLHSVEVHANAATALERMQQEKIGRLLVVDEHNELAGLISRTDLMTAFEIIKSSGGNPSQRGAAVKDRFAEESPEAPRW